jgi:hypothetical protein
LGEETRFVSVARFAELVSLSERTCWNLIRGHLIPVYRVGRRTLIKTDEGCEALERLAVRTRRKSSADRGAS